jgi:hypothetical protein
MIPASVNLPLRQKGRGPINDRVELAAQLLPGESRRRRPTGSRPSTGHVGSTGPALTGPVLTGPALSRPALSSPVIGIMRSASGVQLERESVRAAGARSARQRPQARRCPAVRQARRRAQPRMARRHPMRRGKFKTRGAMVAERDSAAASAGAAAKPTSRRRMRPRAAELPASPIRPSRRSSPRPNLVDQTSSGPGCGWPERAQAEAAKRALRHPRSRRLRSRRLWPGEAAAGN